MRCCVCSTENDTCSQEALGRDITVSRSTQTFTLFKVLLVFNFILLCLLRSRLPCLGSIIPASYTIENESAAKILIP